MGLFVAAAAIPVLWAAPFSKQITFKQPDGTAVQLWGRGDEFYAVFETLDGYTVVFDQGLKAYCYARASADASQLVSTGVQVQNGAGAALGLQPHLRLSPEAVRQQVAARYRVWDDATRVSQRWAALKQAANAIEKNSFMPPDSPTVGVKAGLTLLIDFADDPATIPQSEIINFCNSDNYTRYGNNGSVKQFYAYNSNGKLTYTNAVTIYVRAPMSKTYYNDVNQDAGLQARKLINDTLAVMKTLTNFDTAILPLLDGLTVDGQNEVVAFNVFYAGGNGDVWSMGLWPHSWGLAAPVELSPGGKKVQRYQISNIGDQLEIGTFCHENGHMLCGYPDLYDYTGDSSGAGDWCLMASGSWGGTFQNPGNNPAQICAYLKRASGWATTINLTSASSLLATVSASPGTTNFNLFYRYPKPGVSTEYYLAECRFKTNHDASLPGSGVAVWHIDELGDNSTVNLNPNSSHNNYEATLVQADNAWDLEKNKNNGDPADLFYQGNSAKGYANRLTDSTAPKAQWWNGSRSGLVFRDFSAVGQSMYFIIGSNQPVPVIVAQPTNQTVFSGGLASLSVGVSGFPPFGYQWFKAGQALGDGTAATYSITNVQPAQAGDYQVVVTNTYGAVTSSVATLTVVVTVPLEFALNNSTLRWTTGSGLPWYGQADVSHDQQAAARSYFVGDAQQTWLRTTTNGPGTLTFWWMVSSEPDADVLSFTATGGSVTNRLQISGQVDWNLQTVFVPEGPVTLQFTYSKDADTSIGVDAGFVDQVSFTPGATAPYIVTQPVGGNILAATPFALSVKAGGTPPLSYQWRRDGAELPGATTSALLLPSPGAGDAGVYSVKVSSPYGTITSADAYLAIVPLVVGGDNSLGQINVSELATNATAIAAGAWHSLALRRDGTVLAWGENYDGQCDIPTSLSGVRALAGGGYHSLALKSDGTVAGWGADYNGQANPPPGLSGIKAVAAGMWHSLALRGNGTVVAWGDNSLGQTNVPAGLNRVVAIAAGGNHGLALRLDGTVVGWGDNIDAMGNFSGQATVPWDLSQVAAIGAGLYHSLAVKSNGTVVAWGDNSQGQCLVPAGLSNVVAVAGGGGHSVALLADGTVRAWGNNWNGQCTVPQGLSNVIAIAAGDAHTLLLLGAPAGPVQLVRPAWQTNQFSVWLTTVSGKNYTLQYSSSLLDTNWTAVSSITGAGTVEMLRDPAASTPQRFYRVVQW